MKIGFIGLGNVGGKLAGSLLRNKFSLAVMDLDNNLVKDFTSKGSETAKSPKELAEKVDLIITCLPSPKICSEVMEAEKLELMKPNTIGQASRMVAGEAANPFTMLAFAGTTARSFSFTFKKASLL